MRRTPLSCLLALMIVIQSLTAVVEAHAFDLMGSAHDALHQSLADSSPLADTTDTGEQNTPLDHILHCPHHGCHSPLFVSGGLSVSLLVSTISAKPMSRDFAPEAPVS